jgi:hypothetical protein
MYHAHQLDRAFKTANGEAGKNGGQNPLCLALLRAHRLLAAKILSSLQLQTQLERLQKQYVKGNETLVIEKYGETRWKAM